MSNKVKIAIDAMGGEKSPKKIVEGIEISLRSNRENFFYLYGQKDLLEKEISKKKFTSKYCEIIDTKDIILDNESPLAAAKWFASHGPEAVLVRMGKQGAILFDARKNDMWEIRTKIPSWQVFILDPKNT